MGRFAKIEEAEKKTQRCVLAKRLSEVEDIDDDDWAYVRDTSRGVPTIHKNLALLGVDVSSTTVTAHRNGTCLCAKGA